MFLGGGEASGEGERIKEGGRDSEGEAVYVIVVRVGTTLLSLAFSLHDCVLCSVLNP